MPDIFSPIKLGSMEIANRFARSATHSWMADENGNVGEGELEVYRALSAGGVGLIITGHAYIRRDGKCSAGMLGIDDDGKIASFRKIAEAVHSSGGAKVVAQINFGGAQIPKELRTGALLAPSPREDVPEAREMTTAEAEALIEAYVAAAHRAKEAGLDGVELHGAHGYLINQFLSPATNRRADKFGGSLENRARFLCEIVFGVRKKLGREFPLLIKIASSDGGIENGLTLGDSIKAAGLAARLGLDAVEVSGGMRGVMNTRKVKKPEDEGYFADEAAAFKKALSIPVISVGGWRTLAKMEDVVAAGMADMISMSRPLIREPGLVAKFKAGSAQKSSCISCNECLKRKDGLRCRAEGR